MGLRVEVEHGFYFGRKAIGVLGVLTVTAGAVLTVSPSAFASPAININVPQIQGFSSYPSSYFLENQPDEYSVTMQGSAITATSTPETTTTYTYTKKPVVIQVAHTSRTMVMTRQAVPYRYGVDASGGETAIIGSTSMGWHSGSLQSYGNCPSNPSGMGYELPNYVRQGDSWHQNGYSWTAIKRVFKVVEAQGSTCYYLHRSITSWHYQTTTSYTPVVTYQTVRVPTVTKVSAQGLHVTSAQLEGVLPGIEDVTPGSLYDGQEYWAGDAATDGGFCDGGTTPLISPSNPDFPDYSGDLAEYTPYFESLHICTFNPTFIQGNNVQLWQLNGDHAALLLRAEYRVTVSYTLTTTVNGKVTSQVPETQTQDVWSPVYRGPTWPIYAVTGVSCTVNNGMEFCPGRAPFPVASGT